MFRLLLDLLRQEGGWSRVWVGLGMAITMAGGGFIYYQAQDGTPPAEDEANVWMDPSGGGAGCARHVLATYDAASDCSSVTNACNVAQAGDIVRVRAGSYGAQTTSCQETNWVTYYLDASATFSSAGPTVGGNFYMKFIGGTITEPVLNVQGSSNNFLWFEDNNSHFDGPGAWSSLFYIDGTDVTLIGPGEIGPNSGCYGSPTIGWITGSGTSNILIEGFTIHDVDICNGGEHTETIRIDSQSGSPIHDVILRGNNFYGSDDTTSTIFITAGNAYNIMIENNFFSSARSPYPIFIETQSPSVTLCDRYTIQYNSFNEIQTGGGVGAIFLFQCGSSDQVVIRGNVFPFNGCGGDTWEYNVVQDASDPGQCGGSGNVYVSGTDGEIDNLNYVDPTAAVPNLHIDASAEARNAGNPNSFPAEDIDGETRPLDAGNNENVDSGADERS